VILKISIKNVAAILWAIPLFLSLVAPAGAQSTFVGIHGHLSVRGNQIVDQAGQPVALHGMSLYGWRPEGTKFYNSEAVSHLARDWKCTVIRIPILPRAYHRNPTNEINKVRTVVDACVANGIYAVVDWHAMRGAENDVVSAKSFFATVAAAYGNTSNILYETWNEPEQESWAVIKAYHEAVIPVIRAHDPGNIIICGSRHWDQECAEASLNPLTCSSNIAYSIHFYAATHRQDKRDKGSEALKNGVALFATEYGTTEATGGGRMDVAETQRWWDWLASHQISCANWSMAALPETSAALQPGASFTGPWPDAVLKPSGMLVRDYIVGQE
jgi:endoglucanase